MLFREPLKAALASAGPSDDGALLVRDADDGVVETCLHVRDAVVTFLLPLALTIFSGSMVSSRERDRRRGRLLLVLLNRLARSGGGFGFLGSFGAGAGAAGAAAGGAPSGSFFLLALLIFFRRRDGRRRLGEQRDYWEFRQP